MDTKLEDKIWDLVHGFCEQQSCDIPDFNRRELMDSISELIRNHIAEDTDLISRKTLIDNGFMKNELHSTDVFDFYEKEDVVLETSLNGLFTNTIGAWDLRKKIDSSNSTFIATVFTWEEVSKALSNAVRP